MKRIIRAAAALVVLGTSAGIATAQTPITTVLYNDTCVRPVFLTGAPGDTTRQFVLEAHQGDIEILIDGVKNATPFLDLSAAGMAVATGNEQGLLGLAFHPDYETNGHFFVYFTQSAGGTTRVMRFTATANPNLADTTSGVTVFTVGQPQSNHNGGMLAFSPNDGYLYVGLGDGGSGNDTGPGHVAGGNAQSLTTRLGKILRIDPSTDPAPSPAFSVPSDNPFFAMGFPAREVWAYGLRNHWRFSFDRENGDLWIGDVGQDTGAAGREEVDHQPASSPGGENYGWNCMEGNFATGIAGSGCTAFSPGLTGPIVDYPWGNGAGQGRAVVGGYVYRGDAIPDLDGTYFYSDYASENLWSLDDGAASVSPTVRNADLAPRSGGPFSSITAWGEDTAGELYLCQIGGIPDKIFKLVPDTAWTGLGCETLGVTGEPVMWGSGSLVAGTSGSLNLENARPGALTLLAISLGESATPAFGGTLKPSLPFTLEIFLLTNGSGEITVPWASWPAGLPSGTELVLQWLVDDPAALGNVAMSNALKGVTP